MNVLTLRGDNMINLTFEQFNNLSFTLYEGNPVLKHPLNSFVVADPSVLTPDMSHDGKFHLFCHTFFGVYRYSSDDGIAFKKENKIVNRAMRPNINFIDGKYYLFYERTLPVICNLLSLAGLKWKSEIYCTESCDLKRWTEPYPVIVNTRAFESDSHGTAISNPFLLKLQDGYRLYYSCGQTFIEDCSFCEPTHISYAESDSISKDYISREKPIISPDKAISYLNLCSGCLKVYRLQDCYIGLQNGLFEKEGKSHSAIMLLKSDDGVDFQLVRPFLLPQMCGDNNWMAQYVYACCLTYYENRLRLYFNARDVSANLTGRENIGIFEAEI